VGSDSRGVASTSVLLRSRSIAETTGIACIGDALHAPKGSIAADRECRLGVNRGRTDHRSLTAGPGQFLVMLVSQLMPHSSALRHNCGNGIPQNCGLNLVGFGYEIVVCPPCRICHCRGGIYIRHESWDSRDWTSRDGLRSLSAQARQNPVWVAWHGAKRLPNGLERSRR
jgi:hypothetical protein